MKGNRQAVMLALLLLSGCGKSAPPSFKHIETTLPVPDYKFASENLLDLMHGATVIDRTGELSLQSSAQQAFDGDYTTSWSTPPDDLVQSATIALRARSRLSRAAFSVAEGADGARMASAVKLESSLDGTHFSPLVTFDVKSKAGRGPIAVSPVEAAFVRATTLSNRGGVVADVSQLQLFGEELPFATTPPMSGEWESNGARLFLNQKGNLVEGYLLQGVPFFIDGGYDGHSFRFAWLRGNEYGLGVLTVDPTATHISGCEWHEHNVHQSFRMDSWFATRVSEKNIGGDRPDSVAAYILRTGAFPLYGLKFDDAGTLDVAASGAQLDRIVGLLKRGGKVRFSAQELRENTEPANRARAQKELDSLRAALAALKVPVTKIEFGIAGKERTIVPIWQPIQRYLYSRIDLELVGR